MKRNSTAARRNCIEAHRRTDHLGREVLDCHVCKLVMAVHTSGWEADHIRRHAEGGDDSGANVWPICPRCHHDKSRRDTSEIAKGKRIGERGRGIRRSARPMMGSRSSGWRKRMDGSVERR